MEEDVLLRLYDDSTDGKSARRVQQEVKKTISIGKERVLQLALDCYQMGWLNSKHDRPKRRGQLVEQGVENRVSIKCLTCMSVSYFRVRKGIFDLFWTQLYLFRSL
jgi:hypothetical protein